MLGKERSRHVQYRDVPIPNQHLDNLQQYATKAKAKRAVLNYALEFHKILLLVFQAVSIQFSSLYQTFHDDIMQS